MVDAKEENDVIPLLFATDVDGTILPRGGVISERTRNAVRACRDRGIPFVIASGRWYIAAKTIADALGQTDGVMIISNGGAVVRMDGSVLKEWTLTRERAEQAWRIARGSDVMTNAFVRDAVYRVNTRALREPPRGLGDYLGGAYRMVHDDEEAFRTRGLESPYKLEVYSDDPERLDALRERFLREGFSVSSAYWTNLEIMEDGCGKGTALEWLLRELDIPRERAVAFGDNTNDLSLLEAAGLPVAVANAAEELKRAARVVAPSCEEDGVAQIVERALKGGFE